MGRSWILDITGKAESQILSCLSWLQAPLSLPFDAMTLGRVTKSTKSSTCLVQCVAQTRREFCLNNFKQSLCLEACIHGELPETLDIKGTRFNAGLLVHMNSIWIYVIMVVRFIS